MINSKFISHLLAGLWFAAAGVIPVAYYFLRFEDYVIPIFGGSLFLTAAVPVLLAGFCGLCFGSEILKPDEDIKFQQAVGRGLVISSLAYFLMFSIAGFVSAIGNEDALGGILLFLFMFLYGLLFVGWLVILTGAVAGALLYFCRLKFIKAPK